jgi:hypothetical protein
VRPPILGTSCRVEGEDVELSGADQSIIHHDQPGLKGSELTDIVRAQCFQLADIRRVDLVQLRITLRGECSIVTRPVSSGTRQWHLGGRRGCDSALVTRIRLRCCGAWGRKPRNKVIAGQTRECGHLHGVSVVQRPCRRRADHNEHTSDDKEAPFHLVPRARRPGIRRDPHPREEVVSCFLLKHRRTG